MPWQALISLNRALPGRFIGYWAPLPLNPGQVYGASEAFGVGGPRSRLAAPARTVPPSKR